MPDEDNGTGASKDGQSTVVVTLNRADFTIQVSGKTQNYDEALCMLDLARRWFENRIRALQAEAMLTHPPADLGRLFRRH